MPNIRTLDDLVEYASLVLENEAPYEPVSILANELAFQTKVDGAEWDTRVNAKHARYILALQESLDDLIDEMNPDARGDEPPLVRTKIEEGSSDMYPDVIEFAKALITPMTPQDTFIAVVTGIAATAGYFVFKRWMDHKTETSQLSEHEETKRQLIGALHANAENYPDTFANYEKPVKTLIGMLDDEDAISVGGSPLLPPEEVKKATPKRRRSKSRVTYADGDYILNEIDYSQGEMILHLEQEGVRLKAYTSQLDEADAEGLFAEISERQLSEELPLELLLQMNVQHTDRVIQYGSVVGFGGPRLDKRHILLCEILEGPNSGPEPGL